MDTTKIILFAFLGLFTIFSGFDAYSTSNLGSALTQSAALSRTETFNFLDDVVDDLGASASLVWDPGAITSSTIATTSVTVNGAALGDIVIASLDSGTSTDAWDFSGKVSAANTVLVILQAANDNELASLNLTTTTIRVRVSSSTLQSTK